MVEITAAASQFLHGYLKQKGSNSAIRITKQHSRDGDKYLELDLDIQKEFDKCYQLDGLQFLVHETLLRECGTIKVDYVISSSDCGCGCGNGFLISSERDL